MHRNAHYERHRGTELIDEPALAGGSWSEDYYCRMDERFCAALSRVIADGREHRRDLCGEWVTATGNWVNDLAWAPSMPVSDRTARARAEEAGRPHLFLF